MDSLEVFRMARLSVLNNYTTKSHDSGTVEVALLPLLRENPSSISVDANSFYWFFGLDECNFDQKKQLS